MKWIGLSGGRRGGRGGQTTKWDGNSIPVDKIEVSNRTKCTTKKRRLEGTGAQKAGRTKNWHRHQRKGCGGKPTFGQRGQTEVTPLA